LRKDGSLFCANVILTALRDVAGNLQGFSKVTRDLTERKQAEAGLRESEERFRTLVRDLQVGVILQGPRAEIIMANRAAPEMLGLSADQLMRKTSFDPDWDGHPLPRSEPCTSRGHRACR